MSFIKKIVKEVLLTPVRVIQGAVEAIDETLNIIAGEDRRKPR